MEKPRPAIYVAGPMTKPEGQYEQNIRRGIDAAEKLFNEGFAPICPMLDSLWGLVYPHTWEEWMEIDLRLVEISDGVLRLPGESKGADTEVKYATELLKPVAYSIPELVNMFFPKEGDVIQLRGHETP